MNRSGAPLPAENAARYFASKSSYGIWTGLMVSPPPGNFWAVCSIQYGPVWVQLSWLFQMVRVTPAVAGAAPGLAASAGFAGAAAAAGAVVAAGAAAGAAGLAASAGLGASAGLAGAAGGAPQAERM